MAKITIDPITRIEGHLKIEIEIEEGKVVDAKSSGTMFRGFEIILKGRDPRDAQHLTQRICGVCPASHGLAASLALESAFSVKPPENARIMRNLVLSSNYLQSHILHFYHLAALDYVKGPDTAPFIPRYEGDYRLPEDVNSRCVSHYLEALKIRRMCHEMLALFGGKMPCHMTFCPGGITESPSVDKIAKFRSYLKKIRKFIDNVYIPDVLAVAKAYSDYAEIGAGCKNLLAYGVFDLTSNNGKRLLHRGIYTNGELNPFNEEEITESVQFSWYKDETEGLNPKNGETEPDVEKRDAYSWLKSPRYGKKVYEVGPLARMGITYLNGEEKVKELISGALTSLGISFSNLFSVLGRHVARALECKFVADKMDNWLLELKPDEPTYNDCVVPDEGEGIGLTEAPRGALGHWIKIKDKKILRYQVITPTNWNASCKDKNGNKGPMEQALMGTAVPDLNNPFSIIRIVRSFDPCLACSVHIIRAKGKIEKFRVV